ncbi:quinone-reactive Ni/Fe-hydrogenase small chain precursor [bacterium BMS3Abin01]|nr:quinone-reactive Ni/Fe-hydrogenase small chain precursor [bacterium BMS3Abin01]
MYQTAGVSLEEALIEESIMHYDVSRRDFLKLCGGTAAMLGLSQAWIPQIASALEQAAKRPPVIWLSFQSCSGCFESLAKADYPDVATIVLDIISLNYQEVIMAAAGTQSEKNLDDTVAAGGYITIVEGAIATGIPEAMMVGGKTSEEIVGEVTANGAATIAVGTCAAYGGVQAMNPNPTGAKGVSDVISTPVINIPGCPSNPDTMVSTITYYLLYKEAPKLDSKGRPKFAFSQKVHDNCDRRAHFDSGEYVEEFGGEEEAKNYCLYKMGCKGPETHSPCPLTLWNSKQNWCIGSGNGCIGCMEPDFWDEFAGFYDTLPNVPVPGFIGVKTSTDYIGSTLVTATMTGIGIHAIATAAKGRFKENDDISEGSDD